MKNFPILLAWRYIKGKKNSNAINIITGIAIVGLGIEAAALIVILSVFNGFESIISQMYNQFNPEIKCMPIEGKTFEYDDSLVYKISQILGVKAVSGTLEEVALFGTQSGQVFGKIKGVDSNFMKVNNFEKAIVEGEAVFGDGINSFALVGYTLSHRLSVDLKNIFDPIKVYMVRKAGSGPFASKPFVERDIQPVGVFIIQQEIDKEYILTDLSFVQQLVQKPGQISAFEIGLEENARVSMVKNELDQLLEGKFQIADRFEQDATFLKLMNIEKWVSFAIMCLALILVAFNLVGALWLIVLDKKKDIAVLKSMGMYAGDIKRMVIYIGALLGVIGFGIGTVLSLILYFLHKEIGLVKLEGALVDRYPSELSLTDFFLVAVVVIFVAVITAIPASKRTQYITPDFRDE